MAETLKVFLVLTLVLGVFGWPSTNLQLNKCDSTNPRQLWNLTTIPTNGYTAIQLSQEASPGFDPDHDCLDTNYGPESNNPPHTWPCDPTWSNSNQYWNISGSTSSALLIGQSSEFAGRWCLEPSEPTIGAQVVLGNCTGDISQSWTLVGTNSSLLFQSVAAPSFCLDVGSFVVPCEFPPFNQYPYCDPNLDVVERVQDLVGRMTLDEKAQTLYNGNQGIPRLGVPQLWFSEALHGVVSGCGDSFEGNTGCPTSFPHALALGATFNRTLWTAVGSVISTEARSLNNQGVSGNLYWAPDINLFRDPRWGRGQEVPGEDPFLNGEYVMHFSRAMQEGDDPRYLKVVSTAKHFADYDLEGNGGVDRGSFDAIVSDQDQVEYYWPAWRAAVEGAHIQSVMCSYNGVNGVPSCGNALFMNEVMRGQWGFDGFVVSDCGAVTDPFFTAYILLHYAGSRDEQVTQAITSGCDLECGNFYPGQIPLAVNHSVLAESDLDTAVSRVWRHGIMLGLLDPDVTYRNITMYGPQSVDSPTSRALAFDAAVQSMVLLQNRNNLLPLRSNQRVALLGPHFNATEDLISIYHGTVELVQQHSPLMAFQSRGVDIVGFAPGCVGTDGDDPDGDTGCLDTSGFEAAASLAAQADVAIVFVGLTPGQMNNDSSDAREDEGWDRHITTLPGYQEELIQQIFAANNNTVVVLIHGAPLSIEWTQQNVPAILDAHYPGELGGDAIAAVLFGDVSPAGRLTTTYYPSNITSARPISDMNLRDNGGITYLYYQGTPLWPFGYGLSYTTFEFTPLNDSVTVDSAAMAAFHSLYYASRGLANSPAVYMINVTNTGDVASDCVVLGFVSSSDPDSPIRELFDYDRVFLLPGQTVTVVFSVPPSVLSLVDKMGNQQIRPGNYLIQFGVEGTSENVKKATLIVQGEPKTLFSLEEVRNAFFAKP